MGSKKEIFRIFISIVNEKSVMEYLKLLKEHHKESYEHSLRVGLLCIYLGHKNFLSIEKIRLLGYSGLLHDIGKIYIPLSILTKKSKLNEKEIKKIREHPRRGFVELKNPKFEEVRKIIIMHHEFCSSPYPRKGNERRKTKRGERRSKRKHGELAQILTVADNYDALSNIRAYHKPLGCKEIKEIMGEQFTGKREYVNQIIEKCFVDNFIRKD
jgi:HD-GYP domain-containing protein (c-di-GMP phosphodiesterase class II)